jgi:hypothetical protein
LRQGTGNEKWKAFNSHDMDALAAINVHEALRIGMGAAGAQAGAAWAAAMAGVDPHLAGQVVQLGLG